MTNRFRVAGSSKASGQFCSSQGLRGGGGAGGGGGTGMVWSVSDREALRNEGLAGGRGGM